MIIFLASRFDYDTASIAAHWQSKLPVSVLTPQDLCQPGWRWKPGFCSDGTFSLAGRVYRNSEIQAVITRISFVSEHEFPMISEMDRSYVAAEIQAFLLGWLSDISCLVLNCPSPNSLFGPGFSKEKWLQIASLIGLTTTNLCGSHEVQSSPPAYENSERINVTIVGNSVFNAPNEAFSTQAKKLALYAEVSLLSIWAIRRFVQNDWIWTFESASPLINLGCPEIWASVLELVEQNQS